MHTWQLEGSLVGDLSEGFLSLLNLALALLLSCWNDLYISLRFLEKTSVILGETYYMKVSAFGNFEIAPVLYPIICIFAYQRFRGNHCEG